MWILLVFSAIVAPLAGSADSFIVLADFEGAVSPWRSTELVAEPVHGGQRALRWDVAASSNIDSPRLLADWTRFDELRFWAYLPQPVDFKIPLIFASEGGYYITDWQLDWSGWKEHRITLADCGKAHEPAGWDQIGHFGFRGQGYGQPEVPAGLTLVFDDFALHSPDDLPETDLEALLARERREKMNKLKERGNPYYLSVLDSLENARPEPSLPDELTSAWQFAGFASNALATAWAAAWEESPRKGDATLIAHASALIDFCLSQQEDGSWFYSRKWESGDPNSDRFALGPLMDAIYWLRQLPQGEEAWKRWEAPLKELVEFQYEHWGQRSGHAWSGSAFEYPNQDVFHLYEMALAHGFWGDGKYQESAQKTLDGLEAHLLPDGGLNYIGPETESPCYHDLNVLWLARYYNLTGDERARELLVRTTPYYPLTYSNEGRPEYYTDCWWKHYWSDGAACGPEIIAGITGDPQNKWLADRLLERVGPGAQSQAIYAGMFYRDDVEPQPLPDNYVKLDRNISGPRGRFGSWYFAATPGGGARDTFVGAMVCEPDRADPLNGAFLAANIEVALGGEGARDRTHLYISGPDDSTDTLIADDVAAIGARYSPRKPYINSVVGREVPPTPWQATQVWLLTRHGLVGLVEIEATEEQTVPYIGGELRFGPSAPLTYDEAAVLFRCGAITCRLLEGNFATVEMMAARPGYAQKATNHSAVILRTPGDSYTARPGEPLRYAAVVAPEGTAEVGAFERLELDGAWGFSVAIGGEGLRVLFNPSDEAVTVRLPTSGGADAEGRAQVDLQPRSVRLLRANGREE
jgi:hypothetical protein